jgi:DNA invertase Pin-like site-specific DNA recombinase
MLLIGYIRVSKADGSQVLDLQKDALLAAGVNEDRIYSDSQSGSRHDNRPGLINCLKALQPGNTLVIWKLDRLGRSLKDLVKRLNISKAALCEYVNCDGYPKESDTKLLISHATE